MFESDDHEILQIPSLGFKVMLRMRMTCVRYILLHCTAEFRP